MKSMMVDQACHAAVQNRNNQIEINHFHKLLGHPGKEVMKKTSDMYKLKLMGNVKPCMACNMAKSRQKDVTKVTAPGHYNVGERLHIDISLVKTTSYGGSKFWLLIVDEKSNYCWTHFLTQKSDVARLTVSFVKNLAATGKVVKYIRCNNAGENTSFEQLCMKQHLNIQFEYLSPGTPRYSGTKVCNSVQQGQSNVGGYHP
jgi:hypothetical protein